MKKGVGGLFSLYILYFCLNYVNALPVKILN